MMLYVLLGLFLAHVGNSELPYTCCQKWYWTGQCTLCPAAWYQTCNPGYNDAGQRGCGFLNAGCEGQCHHPCLQKNYGCGCGQGTKCLTPKPTQAPTPSPTNNPTPSPTAAPTVTNAPTRSPTAAELPCFMYKNAAGCEGSVNCKAKVKKGVFNKCMAKYKCKKKYVDAKKCETEGCTKDINCKTQIKKKKGVDYCKCKDRKK